LLICQELFFLRQVVAIFEPRLPPQFRFHGYPHIKKIAGNWQKNQKKHKNSNN